MECFTCKVNEAGNELAGPYSAYCADCQPWPSGFQPRGKECQCASCGEVFTAVSAFDLHQRIEDGKVTCLPLDIARKNGRPVFAAYRERDGVLIWGEHRDGEHHRSHDSSNLAA